MCYVVKRWQLGVLGKKGKVLLPIIALYCSLFFTPVFAKPAIRLGVLAFRPDKTDLAKWRPFADYLESYLHRRVELTTYDFPEMERAAYLGKLDIIISNPSFLILMRSRTKMTTPLATLVRLERQQKLKSFGGVIVARKGNIEISSLHDLRSKRIAAVSTSSLGGYQMQAVEMLEAGVSLPKRSQLYITGMPHDRVIEAVLTGKADAGFVRGGVLEEMVREGRLNLDHLKIIHSQVLTEYPYMSSTRVYPEWPVMVMPHVDDEAKSQIAVALFSLKPTSVSARAAGIYGFTVPAEYRVVDFLLQRLRLPPYEKAPAFTLNDVWEKHAFGVLTLTVAILLLSLSALYMWRLNYRLSRSRLDFKKISEDLELVLSAMPDLLFELGADGRCYRVWTSQSDVLPVSKEALFGKTLPEIMPNRAASVCMRALREAGEKEMSRGGQFELVFGKRSSWFELSISRKKVAGSDGQRFIMLLRDITERKRAQQELEQVASHDDLTGLFNRRHFMELAKREYRRAVRLHLNLSVVVIDVDHFKAVNDTHGHAVGDIVLQTLAQAIQKNIREIDIFARLGGDEFVLLLPGASEDQAFDVIERARQELAKAHMDAGSVALTVSISAGVSSVSAGGDTFELMLHNADTALYQAKESGRGCVSIYFGN